MTSVWLDWAQESPVARLRVPLAVGAGTGVALAAGFGELTGLHWSDPTALEGRYANLVVVVAAEVILAGAGAIALAVGVRFARGATAPSSRWVGPVMGVTILGYALVSAVVVLPRLQST